MRIKEISVCDVLRTVPTIQYKHRTCLSDEMRVSSEMFFNLSIFTLRAGLDKRHGQEREARRQ